MNTNLAHYNKKDLLRLRVEHAFQDLIQFKKEENKELFNKQLIKILPAVKKYINRRLNTAIRKGHFTKNKYQADDFIDQLFIEIYEHVDEVKKSKDFYLWLFKKTDELLGDIIVEEEFNDFFFKNIDTYSKPEWDEMAENFSIDGDGDLLMVEELDDISYNHNEYTLNHVFIEDDEIELTKKLDKTLHDDDVNKHIKMVLHNLPLPMQTVFELANQQHLNFEEIAELESITYSKVKKLLDDAKKALQVSLFNRYGS